MLNRILNNLKTYPNDECYQINDKIYKNCELYKYVCNIYNYLLENNKEKKNIVVCGHKDIYMIATFLACSCAGITYVPIDNSIPTIRKEKIISQINPKLIIDSNIEKIMCNENYQDISKIYMKDENIYYIIFTSGSTGEPKGVKITYANLKSCIKWLEEICNVNKAIILNQANFSFDLSVADIYLSLVTRSKHYILERNVQKDYQLLFKELNKSNASLAIMTPSFADLLLADKSFNQKLMPNLQKILFCGEKLNKNTVTNLNCRFENLEIINCYGPTECTFAVTSTVVSDDKEISIGVPKSDTKIYIVNENLEKLEDNQIGEIVITGASVSDGYVKEELMKEIFITYENQRAYCTGDLAYTKNNQIYYVGRKDKQIKYKGYRIELLEIEDVLNKLEFVEKSFVTVIKNEEEKINRIIAFVKEKEKYKVEIDEIKKCLKNYLSDYMIPIIKIVDNIPLNENGKVDEKVLKLLK